MNGGVRVVAAVLAGGLTCLVGLLDAPGSAASAAPGATVHTGGFALNVRSGPSTGYRVVGWLRDGSRLAVQCQVYGRMIRGTVRRTAVWDRLRNGRYVSDAYVRWARGRPRMLPWCGQRAPESLRSASAFVAWASGPARQSMRRYRVPASVTIAQSILESGWGRSELSRVDHNFFGMKCSGAPGPIAIGCRTYPTTECRGKKCFRTTASFRVYRGAGDSFADHGRYLAKNPRYRKAFGYTKDPNRFTVEIHKAGYATSPTYAASLVRLMKQHNLYRYDR